MRRIAYLDRNQDVRNTVLLGGSARSGTTWLAEVLNHRNVFRYMFEPLRPGQAKGSNHLNIRQYLRPDDPAPDFGPILERVVTGRIRSLWIDKYNRKFFCDRRLIKVIRGNLLLGWLRVAFPEMKIVYMLRHPGAVALSRMTLGWQARLDEILAQEPLVRDHLEPDLIDKLELRSPFEEHVCLWCVENIVPLRQLASGDAHVAMYEHLCTEPAEAFESLFGAADVEFDGGVVKRATVASRLSHAKSAVKTGEDRIGRWRTKVADWQLDRLEAILSAFGLDVVYTRDVMPHTRDPVALF